MRPIRPTSAWAMKPVRSARRMERAQMTTTRQSMPALSSGTRVALSIPISRLLRPRAAAARPLLLLEEHRCRSRFGAERVDECGEGIGEALALRGGQSIDHGQDLLLRHGRRALEQGPSVLGQIENEAPRVARVALA